MSQRAVKFEEPPPRRGGGYGADPVEVKMADELAAHPSEWGIVGEYASHHDALLLQRRIRRGAPGSAWSAGFRATVRKVGDRQWNVYARLRRDDEKAAS